MDNSSKGNLWHDKNASSLEHTMSENDFAELTKKIEELEQRERRLNLILESANNGFWDWDVASDSVYFNPTFFTMLGYKANEFPALSNTLKMLVDPADLPQLESRLVQLITAVDDNFSMELRLICKDKSTKWILCKVKITERNQQGVGMRVLGIHSDITSIKISDQYLRENEQQLKQQNEELITLNEELAESNKRVQEAIKEMFIAKEKAEESDRLKSAFLANMSHEIRTPMNGIVGFASLLTEPGISAESILQYVEIINNSSRQLLALIDDIIDISKIEAGQIKVRLDEVHLNTLFIELYSLYATLRDEEEIQFSFSLGMKDNEDLIVTDGVRLRQVINNLLNNAFKFTNRGEIIFGYRTKKEMLEFFVSDTGIGIPIEFHQIIFDRFRQVDSNGINKATGTGLGLAISKALVALMGGKIWLDSEINKGTNFHFTIPLLRSLDKKRHQAITTSKKETFFIPDLHRITILIAEDEEINYLYLKELLDSTKVTVIRAVNGEEAVHFCKTNPEIGLVLLDIKMPILNGYEAAQQIKSFRNDLPIIAQTAYAMTDDREKAIRAGCNDYISKPIEKQLLFEIINKTLKANMLEI